jgi:hypothetical protein
MITINALNEYDPKVSMDWKRTIDSQGGLAVVCMWDSLLMICFQKELFLLQS